VFAVELQVPCDNEEAVIDIINDEQLDQVFNACGENVLDPYFCLRLDLEGDCICSLASKYALFTLDELKLAARFGDNVVVKDPCALNLLSASLQAL